ncbi:ribonuclease HI [Weissella uvarum]|uniref:ribonuclease H family protein n=1 Tax=Weissella uvarum TaxID=1479233 RepID=UPI00195FAFCE|nr:ribonuclease H family protein [Weissella uvarum]MBM7616940.1 ribonuclease HI [Weissella uvarum]MCM0594611.1 viroplasmin family protein [Weissella uvarum]
MKTYAIVGNEHEGIYTAPWSQVQPLTQTKPAPKYKGFNSKAEAQAWFNAQNSSARQYQTAYNGDFKANPSHFYMFTDGGSRNTGNHAGGHVNTHDKAAWALAIYAGTDLNQAIYTDSKAYFGRTNNEMELLGLINALLQAQRTDAPVTIVSDSKYVLDGVTNWMYNWQANGWQKSSGEIANLTAWQQIYDLVQTLADRLHFIWVKGHATSQGNVLVDELLNQAMDQLS